MFLPKHRAERPEWYTDKGWERERMVSMRSHLSDKDTIYYIGAEEGEMPALCQMWGAKVVMFEPNDKVWPNIYGVWLANGLDAPTGCFEGFAANETTDSHIQLNKWPESISGPIIPDHAFRELRHPGDIPRIKVDDFYMGTKLEPTALSIDVEGSEWEVLKGASQVIKQFSPKIWLSLHPEFMFDQYGKYSYEVRRWLIDQGYKETLLDYQHEAHFYYEK